MISVLKQMRRVGIAVVALGSIGLSGTAFAQNTASGTTITNTATVNYTVNSIAQTAVNASTNFVVDTAINMNITAVANAVTFTPGQTGGAKAFTLTNTSNIASNFSLTPTNLPTVDDFDVNNILVRVDANANGTYEPGTDTATSITNLARNASVTVFIVGDIPGTATNTQTSQVRLTGNAINPATSVAWVNDTAADIAGTVQIVVRNGTANATNTFVVASAALGVTKGSTVISDLLNGTTNPKAIPGSVVEYAITVSNAAGAQTATLTSISDPVPANTTFLAGQYTGTRDVGVKVGAAAETFCLAEAGGTDSNSDGCVINAGAVTVGAPAVTTVAAGTSVVVRFRVTIN